MEDYLTTFRCLEIEKCTEEYSHNFLRVKMSECWLGGGHEYYWRPFELPP
jgi:hypothetical protein